MKNDNSTTIWPNRAFPVTKILVIMYQNVLEKSSNPSPAEPEAASDQMTLTEAVETPTNNVPIKEESPAQASYVPAPYAPYPYHYPMPSLFDPQPN